MRLFIASPVILDDYASIKKDFEGIIEGRWVEEQNLHLTWVFLGDVKDEQPIIDKLQKVSALEQNVAIKALGYFGRPPRVFFARAEEKLLYDKAKEFRDSGFDLYRFKPHITLCRIKSIRNYKEYKEKLKTYRERSLGIILPKIALYESTLTFSGAQYTCRYSILSS